MFHSKIEKEGTVCTVLAYSKVLMDFILKENPVESLKKALKQNVMVPKYLLFQHTPWIDSE